MPGLALTRKRWLRALVACLLLFMAPAAALQAGPAFPDHAAGHHHVATAQADGAHTCGHDPVRQSPGHLPGHAGDCAAVGGCALAPVSSALAVNSPAKATLPLPISTDGAPLASVSPPHKPPRA